MSFGFGVGDFLAVAKLANDIWQKLHDSVDQFAAIRNEVAGLSSLLDEVSKTVSKHNLAPKQAQGLAASGNACRSVLEDLQKLVDKYGGFTNEARGLTANIRKTTRKLKWDQDDVRDLRARITSTITVLRALSESLARDEQARRRICQWLSPLDFPAQQREIYSRRQEGSGKWLLESERFTRWLKTEGGVLLCPGNPGVGKTVLASIVIDHLWNKVRTDDIGVAYIYCDYVKHGEQTPIHLVGSLLKQLTEQRNPVSESLESYYNKHRSSNTDPDPKGAFEVLKAECDSWPRVFIIVDALDECSEKDATRQRLVEGLLSLQGSKRVNILVTSRPIPSILCDFEVWERLGIRASSADIQDYLLGQMDRFSKRVVVGKDLQVQIISTIVDAADGMFLLARLTFDSLVGHKTPKAIKATLNTLSGGASSLDSAYDDAIRRIENQHPDDRDLAKRTLLWISQGKRLLSVAEMQQAVAIELGESDLDPDSTVDCDDIISACTGLVTRGLTSSGCEILRLVHYTTQDYLERTTAKYFRKSEEYLASTCLTYLLFDVFPGALCPHSDASENRVWHEAKARAENYSFYAYAARYWGDHTENCDDEAVRIMTERFLDDHKRVSGALHFVRDSSCTFRPKAFKLEESNPGSAIQLAAYLGLTKIIFGRLENGSEPDVKDWSGATPFFWAAHQGHEDVVRLLMERKDVNPNVANTNRVTPLMVAIDRNYPAVVQILLTYGHVEINAKEGTWGSSALIYAIRLEQNSTQISKLLLACDNIDVNLKDDEDKTPLMVAVESENEEAIRLLLTHRDIQVNERDWRGRTALNIAADQGNTKVMQLLLAHGDIQANIRDKAGQSALHVVARHAKAEAMQLLLAHGDIQANIRDKGGRTALHVVAWQRNAEAMQLLLAHGDIQANIRDKSGRTALHNAAEKYWTEGMRLLLAQEDVQVNIRDNKGSTALHVAIKRGELQWKIELLDAPKIDVAELFLARGDVDVNIRDMDGYSPLYYAVHSGEPDVVQLLLNREDLEISVEDGEVGRLVSVAENLRDKGKEGNAYNAIIHLLRFYSL